MNRFILTLAAVLGAANALAPRSTVPLSSIDKATWDDLSAKVGGRLYDGEPMWAPCYSQYNGQTQEPDVAECTEVQNHKGNATFSTARWGGYRNTNWAACQATGDSCPVDADPGSQMCYQGSVPSKYVDARSVEDIQKTLGFASEHNLRLVIKNTGHDYTGRSSGAGALGLWTRNIQPPIELKRDFVPEGCSDVGGDVITFGAGQQFAGIYEFARQNSLRIVGGSSNTVGAAGGWITGGGHSMLSNELGMGADNVQQLKAVLPNGTFVTANRCQNQDIFFALRGGGGSTFGVVTEMSTLAHPEKPMVQITAAFVNLTSTVASELITIMVENADRWASEGWGGYIILGPLENSTSTFFMATSMLDQSEGEASMKPITDFASRVGALAVANVKMTETYYEVLYGLIADEPSTPLGREGALAMSSRIITRETFQGAGNQQRLSSVLMDILSSSQQGIYDMSADLPPLFICVTAPTSYSQNLPESDKPGGPGASSMTPAWRTGVWHTIHLRPFADNTISDSDAVRDIFQTSHDTMNSLRQLTPNGGAYVNEADPFEADPVKTFWGEANYARLLKIKEQVDPANLLTVHQGVGWDSGDERYACYPDVDTA
ncbi:FAD-dependent oxidoreductase [Aspergillus undulatus]|uniref:FAD-dependent oxidoreductase n=1 Tax=Aspergillus undulatus TaxID=1810928 RepID=UPI003CCDDF75